MVLLELGFQEACWDVGFSCAPGRTPRAGGLVTFTGYFKRLYFLDSMHLKTKQNNDLMLILGRLISKSDNRMWQGLTMGSPKTLAESDSLSRGSIGGP